MKYGTLKQTHPEYDAKLWETLDDLYVGGFQILNNARRYITRQVNETEERYEARLAEAEYVPYLGMIVDSIVANLFAAEPVLSAENNEKIDAFWQEFAKNANLKGDDFSRVAREVFTTAILKRRGFFACDFPAIEEAADNQAQEDALGKARGYAFEVSPEELVDWNYGDVVKRVVPLKSGGQVEYAYGLLSWAILRREICRRETPEDSRDTFVEEFRVWRMKDGKASYEVYQTEPRARGSSPPRDDEELKLIAEEATSFCQIPIVELCVPPGLWLGNKIGPLAMALFRRRSGLIASEGRSLFPIAVFKHGPEVSAVGAALPPEAQQNTARGHDPVGTAQRLGALGIGYQDALEYVEPKGTSHELVDKQLGEAVDELFRVAHMMASSIAATSSSLGRSGKSKEQDFRALGTVLEAYGAIVRDVAARVHDVIAEARKEGIEWKVHGLDKFDAIDRQIVLEEAKTMAAVNIPSRTFNVQWKTKTALALLGNATPDMQRTIEDEIRRGVVAEEQMRDLMTSALEDTDDGENGIADARAGDGSGGRSRPLPSREEDRTRAPAR